MTDDAEDVATAPHNPAMCLGGHRTMPVNRDGGLVPEGFDFGDGPTPLDSFVTSIVSAHGRANALQWRAVEWAVAMECSLQLEDLHGALCLCAPVPLWLHGEIHAGMRPCLDAPYPIIGVLEDPLVDWFGLHDARPERWNLTIPWQDAAFPDVVRGALAAAQAAGGIPALWAELTPFGPDAVQTTLLGMDVTWPDAASASGNWTAVERAFPEQYDVYQLRESAEDVRTWLWC